MSDYDERWLPPPPWEQSEEEMWAQELARYILEGIRLSELAARRQEEELAKLRKSRKGNPRSNGLGIDS